MTADLERRLLAKVSPEPMSGCWLWTGSTIWSGYGLIGLGGSGNTGLVHRVAFTIWRGPIPKGLVIDHRCRNRTCCRPSHLETVTPRENTRRGANQTAWNMAATHCRRGHPLSGANLRIELQWRGGGLKENRRCVQCERDGRQALRARRTQEAA